MFAVVRNNKVGAYEVHKAGCSHITGKPRMIDAWNSLYGFCSNIEAATPQAAKDKFESENEGCGIHRINPCAKEA